MVHGEHEYFVGAILFECLYAHSGFVFGAGADSGIFPLTNHLVAAINTYLTKDPEGKEADRLIKQRLGFHSFSYESIMDNAAYTFIRRNDQGKIEKLAKKTASVQEERLPEKEKAGLPGRGTDRKTHAARKKEPG